MVRKGKPAIVIYEKGIVDNRLQRTRLLGTPDSDQMLGYTRAQGKKNLLRAQRRFARVFGVACSGVNGIGYGCSKKASTMRRSDIRGSLENNNMVRTCCA